MAEAVAKATPFEQAIIGAPAEGIVGLAVKLTFLHRHDNSFVPQARRGERHDPCLLWPPSEDDRGYLSVEMSLSAIRDIARLVPELAQLCAPALAEAPET